MSPIGNMVVVRCGWEFHFFLLSLYSALLFDISYTQHIYRIRQRGKFLGKDVTEVSRLALLTNILTLDKLHVACFAAEKNFTHRSFEMLLPGSSRVGEICGDTSTVWLPVEKSGNLGIRRFRILPPVQMGRRSSKIAIRKVWFLRALYAFM